MIYQTNEGTLTLPYDYEDGSITILKFPTQKSSLTIVRGEMPPEISLDETVEMQRNLFHREFKSVVLRDNKATHLGISPRLNATEFYCMFDKSGIKQYQMNLLIKQGKHFVTLSYTQQRAFNEEDSLAWLKIKSDFALSPRWYQTMTGEAHE